MHRARVSYRSWLTTQLPGAKGCCRLTQHPGAKGCRRLTQHPGAKLCHRLDKTDFMERKKGVSKWQKLPFNKSRIEINEWARNSSLDLQVRTSPCPVPTQGSHSWEIGNDGVASSGKEGAGGSSSKPGGVEGVTTVPCVPSQVQFTRKLKVLAVCLPRGLLHEGYAKKSEVPRFFLTCKPVGSIPTAS